jgi:crotonobetainyl-CoA:carnitine CoA-transferase CaiB-like acyl-CoA transferase
VTLDGSPLAGVQVLDLGLWRPSAEATRLLCDAGASVVVLEPPGGSPLRAFPELFEHLTAGKRFVTADLKTPEGRKRTLDVATTCDAVLECSRPGTVERLGVGYADVTARNPAVVYCSISGFGATGPLAAAPGHDLNYQAWAGALDPRGLGAPVEPPLPWADLATATSAAFAVSAALTGAARRGVGQRIDIGMTDVLAAWVGSIDDHSLGDVGPADDALPGYGLFPTADGAHVALGVLVEDHFHHRLCDALGLGDLRDLDLAQRSRRSAEVRARIAEAVRGYERDEAVQLLLGAGAPVAPVLSRQEMLAQTHLRVRGTVTGSTEGTARIAPPVRFHPAYPCLAKGDA